MVFSYNIPDPDFDQVTTVPYLRPRPENSIFQVARFQPEEGASFGRGWLPRKAKAAVQSVEAQRGDWSGGPHGDPDWTLEDYQELAADFGLTGFEGFPEDSQLYLGKTLYDLIVFEAQTGRDMSETLESWIESRPGLVLSEENKHMLAVSLGVGAMMPSGRGGLQKIDTKYLDKQGINAHALKKEVLGRRIKGGHYDFYQDKATGRVYLLRRGGRGKPIDTEINIRGGAGG